MYLTLPIPTRNRRGLKNGPVSIEECLQQFLEEETLSGDDAWHCPRCKKPRSASKRLSIVKLPTVLLVHLKRFSFEGPFRNKLETQVAFPLQNFDLTPYVQFLGPIDSQVYNLFAVSVIIFDLESFWWIKWRSLYRTSLPQPS
jgi:ubiquitin carboxyl-terminal hydrolase 8